MTETWTTGGTDRSIIGTCSLCGGKVWRPTVVMVGITDPRGRCEQCGAVEFVEAHGPMLPMVKRP